MGHPDTDRLIEHATQGGAGARVEAHVRQCVDCSREVARWRRSVEAYAWRDGEHETDERRCLDDHAVAALAEGSMPAPAREQAADHLATCARCRSEVASVARSLSSPRVREASARLDPLPRHDWLRVVVPFAAVATIALLLVPYPREVEPVLHRAPPTPPEPAPVAIAPHGPTTSVQVLRWHAVAGADRYRVTLFDEDGLVLWESAVSDTVAGLPPDVPLEAGRSYFWIVSARTGFDRWESSSLSEFSVSAAPR